MPNWLTLIFEKSVDFMPHGHCYFWLPGLLWLHVVSDALIGLAYVSISLALYLLVRKIRLPFGPVFVAFGLFIGLCGLTHFMSVWTVWNPDYWPSGLLKAATAAASVATAVATFYVRPKIVELVEAARLSKERKAKLQAANTELQFLYKKLQAASELRTQFFANVSHELRTPLALIIGPTELLLDDANLRADHKEKLQTIRRNSRSLLKQVNNLLAVAQVEEGVSATTYASFDLAKRLHKITAQFESVAAHKQIEFVIEAPESLMLEADPDLIERVIVNLLSNAFKFTPILGAVRVSLSADAAHVELKVTDNGPGVSAGLHETIFERFRQADGSATREYGGTGLGLAIAKDFVERHFGEITIASEPGKGAEFAVRLPLKAPEGVSVGEVDEQLSQLTESAVAGSVAEIQQAAQSQSSGVDDLTKPHSDLPLVLVVEDTLAMRTFIANTLSDVCQLMSAANGRQGLKMALSLRPQLIVTDLMMPDMSGEDLVREARAHPQLDQVPILMLTARAEEETRIRLLASGVQDYLTKPFLPQELRARVANLLATKRAADTLRGELRSSSSAIDELAAELANQHQQLRLTLEAAEVAKEQAVQANAVKARFLAAMSHEMRTPISVIALNAQVLLKAPKDGQQTQRDRLEPIARSASQLAGLIEGVLEYTQVESSRLSVQPEPVDALSTASELVASCRALVLSPDVQLEFNAPPVALPPLYTDPKLLRVALHHVLANALKHTTKGVVSLRVEATEQWFRFICTDTGPGIANEDLSRLFSPFEQLEPTRHKGISGAGLGLALTKEIIDTLNGRIEVQSVLGSGTQIIISLPTERRL